MLKNNIFNNIGFGTWKLKNNIETTTVINNAVKSGYKLIDTAYSYLNEEAIGNAIFENGRENLIVSGKLWNDDRNDVVNACKRTINNLKCDYLDLYLMHWPASKAVHENWVDINNTVWNEMQKLVELKLTKNIGVSNFKVNQLKELMKTAKIKPIVNQIEFHPGFMQNDIVEYCKENGIIVQAWSPLGSGKMLKKQEIIDIAQKYNKSPAQICLKWCLQNEVFPIVKSTEIERMKENLDIFNFKITTDDMNYLNNLPYLGSSGLDSETITLFN